ncbi:hypothetical protein PIB30_107904, partial [Stylosanthes scabra]|nr:hypothetical protein [Stylosanthes scabra]
ETKRKRHCCFCRAAVVVLASSMAPSLGRRYVACGKVSKCDFFEWIDKEEDVKNESKAKEKRIQCFYDEALMIHIYGIVLNPNRIFISCLNRSCKYLKWIDEQGKGMLYPTKL